MTGTSFVKRRDDLPADFFAVEAAGLRWLAAVPGGVAVARVREVSAESITLDRIATVAPDAAAAREFGRRLAITHRAGAPGFGAPPEGRSGDGYIADLPLPTGHGPGRAWGPFYAANRIEPFARSARDAGAVDAAGAAVLDRVCSRIVAGALGAPEESASRIHGDLWSGNVLWSAAGAVLIDPAARGGHRETDLAMLALFGLPHRADVLGGYDAQWPLAEGWQDRVGLHQLHPLLVHAVLFGRSYGDRAVEVARRYC